MAPTEHRATGQTAICESSSRSCRFAFIANKRRYVFRNIRYAAPPVGDLRWAKPAPPQLNNTTQDGSYGPQCIQTAVSGLNLMGPGNKSPIGAALNQLYAYPYLVFI